MSNFSIAKRLLLAGATVLAFSAPGYAQLDSAMSAAKASTAASAASQQRIENLDDDADQMVREYRAVLQQKDNIALFVDQQDIYLESQKAEIQSLRKQLATVEQIKQGMVPMMLEMTNAIEQSILDDLPFEREARLADIERVKAYMGNPNVTPVEQYRLILNAFKKEVNYGTQGAVAYEGAHPEKPGDVVDFVRFGRVSFVYMSKDRSELARYNLDTRSWDQIDPKGTAAIVTAIRVAKEEKAPDMLSAPIVKSN